MALERGLTHDRHRLVGRERVAVVGEDAKPSASIARRWRCRRRRRPGDRRARDRAGRGPSCGCRGTRGRRRAAAPGSRRRAAGTRSRRRRASRAPARPPRDRARRLRRRARPARTCCRSRAAPSTRARRRVRRAHAREDARRVGGGGSFRTRRERGAGVLDVDVDLARAQRGVADERAAEVEACARRASPAASSVCATSSPSTRCSVKFFAPTTTPSPPPAPASSDGGARAPRRRLIAAAACGARPRPGAVGRERQRRGGDRAGEDGAVVEPSRRRGR